MYTHLHIVSWQIFRDGIVYSTRIASIIYRVKLVVSGKKVISIISTHDRHAHPETRSKFFIR